MLYDFGLIALDTAANRLSRIGARLRRSRARLVQPGRARSARVALIESEWLVENGEPAEEHALETLRLPGFAMLPSDKRLLLERRAGIKPFATPEAERRRLRRIAERAVSPEYSTLPLAGLGLQLLIDQFEFFSVLDIGCGAGRHAEILRAHGKEVSLCDYGRSIYYDKLKEAKDVLIGDFMEIDFGRRFDCLWASHVLEHQGDPQRFLRRAATLLDPGGLLAVTVPPLRSELIGGHLTLWTPGLLLYHLVLAGFNVTAPLLAVYGYNITIIARRAAEQELPELDFDSGDVNRLAHLLPPGIEEGVDGWLESLWWQPETP